MTKGLWGIFNIIFILVIQDSQKLNINYFLYILIDYKNRIVDVLCENDGWRQKFYPLIDTLEYFKDHFKREDKLTTSLKNYTSRAELDFESDSIKFKFSFNEIDSIEKQYDYSQVELMNHFADLLVSYIFDREYKEYVGLDERIKNRKRKDEEVLSSQTSESPLRLLLRRRLK